MKTYSEGKNDFEKFEKARNELRDGGGVLYYPAGTYDFTTKPPGKGLNLYKGVVIRGQAPSGRPLASDGKLACRRSSCSASASAAAGRCPATTTSSACKPARGRVSRRTPTSASPGSTLWERLFGPELSWAQTWATKVGWYSAIKTEWKAPQPGGSHPGDVLVAAGKKYIGAGKGRLVFGCVLEDAAVLDDFLDPGYGTDGFHTQRHCARISVYGSRVLVANNYLPRSRKSFLYKQRTNAGNTSTILFDYGKTLGIDINKELLGHAADDWQVPRLLRRGSCRSRQLRLQPRPNGLQHCRNLGHRRRQPQRTRFPESGGRRLRLVYPDHRRLPCFTPDHRQRLPSFRYCRPQPVDRRQSLQQHRQFPRQRRRVHPRSSRRRYSRFIPGPSLTTRTRAAPALPAPSASGALIATAYSSLGIRHPVQSAQVIKKGTTLADCSFVANKSKIVVPDAKDVKRFEVRAPLTANPPGAPSRLRRQSDGP